MKKMFKNFLMTISKKTWNEVDKFDVDKLEEQDQKISATIKSCTCEEQVPICEVLIECFLNSNQLTPDLKDYFEKRYARKIRLKLLELKEKEELVY